MQNPPCHRSSDQSDRPEFDSAPSVFRIDLATTAFDTSQITALILANPEVSQRFLLAVTEALVNAHVFDLETMQFVVKQPNAIDIDLTLRLYPQ